MIWAVAPAGENSDTHISTRYFGPNAFPIPDMLDGRVSPDLKIELAGDWYKGFDHDHTADAFFRLYIPLFTRRVNLTVWMPIQEWYWISPEKENEILTAIVQRVEKGNAYVELGKTDGILTPNEMIPGETYENSQRRRV